MRGRSGAILVAGRGAAESRGAVALVKRLSPHEHNGNCKRSGQRVTRHQRKRIQEPPRSPQTSPAMATKAAMATPTTPPADRADGPRLSADAEPPTTKTVGDGVKEGDADGKNGTIDAGTIDAASGPQNRTGLANPKKLPNRLLADVRASLKTTALTLTELTATSAEASARKTRATIVRRGVVAGDAAVDAPAARRRRRRPSTTLPIS